MASGTTSLPVRSAFGQTARTDAWWVQPVAVFLGLSVFRESPFAVILARDLRGYASRVVRA